MRRILVVDDHRDSANSLTMLLRLLGSEVRTAFNGTQALAEATAFAPEIVFLDLGMPEMTGYEVARRLRADAALKQPLLIALTGYGSEADRQQCCSAGFDIHLLKPLEFETLRVLLGEAPPVASKSPDGSKQMTPHFGQPGA